MKGNEYGPLNVTIRAQENKLLKQGHFDRMIAANNFDEAVNILRETVYRNDVDDIKEKRKQIVKRQSVYENTIFLRDPIKLMTLHYTVVLV